MPRINLKWGTIAAPGATRTKQPIKSIDLLPGSSDGPCVGFAIGNAVIEIHAEDALIFAAELIETAGRAKKKYGTYEWRWPD